MTRVQHLAKIRDIATARRQGKATPKQLAKAAEKGLREFERDLHRPGNVVALIGMAILGAAIIGWAIGSGAFQELLGPIAPTTTDGGGSGGSLPPDGHSW